MRRFQVPQKLQGILYILLAGVFFATMSLFVRLSGDLPVMQKAFFRNLVAVAASIIILARTPEKFHIKRSSWPGLFIRSLTGTLGLVCHFYAISKLGLADANMLNKMSPFFAMIFSIFLLGEVPSRVDWAAIIAAFLGVLLIIKPTAGIASVYGLIGLTGGLGAGIAYTFVRRLGRQGERGPVIVMCFSVFSCLFTLPFMIAGYQPMSAQQVTYLMLAGCFATGGQLCITKAYTKAPAREISVFDYFQILVSALLGILVFSEYPDVLSFIGYVVIIGVAVFKWAYHLKHDAHAGA